MRRFARALLATTVLLALASTAKADPPADIDATVQQLMANDGVPGMAVGIVEGGKTVLAKGYGVRELGKPAPVDARTLFQIGSTTKAFTSAALALLAEQGKLGWDDRVVDHLPEFQMADPYVTREFTLRDLLTHRSGLGLGAGDLTFMNHADFTRAEVVKALRWLKPQTSFRSQFAYDNVLYAVAGVVIERDSGKVWEYFVRDRLLRPIGMFDSTTDEAARYLNADRAQGHARLGPPFRGEGAQSVLDEKQGLGASVFPAGGIMSSATDMSRWIAVQLAHGQLADGKSRLWSEASAAEMWKPVTLIPPRSGPKPLAAPPPQFQEYALGWFLWDYKGHKIIEHAGGTPGFLTEVVLIPQKNTGFVIMQNSEDLAFKALMYTLLDHYLDLPKTDWGKAYLDAGNLRKAAAKTALATAEKPARIVPQTLDAASLVGQFKDNWYGAMDVQSDQSGLVLTMRKTPGMHAVLKRINGDMYLARWIDPAIEPANVTFVAGEDGKVAHVTMNAASPLADFSYDYQDLDFTPVTPRP
ncbi:serine hydrolase [Novosphingobium sp. FKTRR1]|uniref:serine hydrolase n=1 Tax=Novosphingobium sp. FKTRR1 TaxID=2879118 RepID=UPI001CF0523D|nr:serine hydrolase [Novosphingobium sp. FKTRR1]